MKHDKIHFIPNKNLTEIDGYWNYTEKKLRKIENYCKGYLRCIEPSCIGINYAWTSIFLRGVPSRTKRTRVAVLRFHSSSLEGGAPAVLPVSGSVADFYAGRGAGMIPWNLKSQWTENGGRREDESSKWGEGSSYGGGAAIRRHIRLDEPRITTCHLSARHAFSGSRDARGGWMTRASAGSRRANRSTCTIDDWMENDPREKWFNGTLEEQWHDTKHCNNLVTYLFIYFTIDRDWKQVSINFARNNNRKNDAKFRYFDFGFLIGSRIKFKN